MQLNIRFSGAAPAEFGSFDYESIFAQAVDRFRHRVEEISVYIEDVNGPRGGIDKQCRCVLRVRGVKAVVIRDSDENMLALIHRVANRAAYALSQRIQRRQKRATRSRRQRSLLPFAPEAA